MAILTSKELSVGKGPAPEAPVPAATAAPPVPVSGRVVFVLPFAAPGVKTMAAFYDDRGNEVQVPLDDRRYIVDEPDHNKRDALSALLVKNGFVIEGEAPKAEKPEPEASKEEIVLQHPDGAVDAEFLIGKKKVLIERGLVNTSDLRLVKQLVAKGYIVQNPHALERALEGKE